MILVDPLTKHEEATVSHLPPSMRSTCHMVSTVSDEELKDFAKRIGMRLQWQHNDHFDLNPAKRARALSEGATPVSIIQLVCQNWRRKERYAKRGLPHECICNACPQENVEPGTG